MKTKDIQIGLVYWYEVAMHIDRTGNGIRESTPVRLPAKCVEKDGDTSMIRFMNPASATVETKWITNDKLFDNPYATQRTTGVGEDDMDSLVIEEWLAERDEMFDENGKAYTGTRVSMRQLEMMYRTIEQLRIHKSLPEPPKNSEDGSNQHKN